MRDGDGGAKKIQRAVRLFKRVCREKVDGCAQIGALYLAEGASQDIARGLLWLRHACSFGSADACNRIKQHKDTAAANPRHVGPGSGGSGFSAQAFVINTGCTSVALDLNSSPFTAAMTQRGDDIRACLPDGADPHISVKLSAGKPAKITVEFVPAAVVACLEKVLSEVEYQGTGECTGTVSIDPSR